jgi:hypothetical protein
MTSTDDRRPRSQTIALAGTVFASVVVAAAAGAGTPLLSLYQRTWGFPLWQLALAFALYAVALLTTLLIAGSLSDHLGRRPVLIGALILMVLASTLFLIDDQIGWVIAARAIQGMATGAATSTFTAAIIELASARHKPVMTMVTSAAPVGGLALGALSTGAASDLLTDPTRVVFGMLIVFLLIGIIAVSVARETRAPVAGAIRSLRPRLVVPAAARSWFISVAPLVASGWMFSGLFLGLAPTFDRSEFAIESGTLNGLIVALQPASAALVGLVFSRVRPRLAAMTGSVLMLAGAAVTLAGLASGSLAATAVGAVVGGAGQGAGFGSSLRILAPLSNGTDRAGMFSAVYLIAYASYGIPVLAAGALSGLSDLSTVVVIYCAVVAALAAWALISIYRIDRRSNEPTTRSKGISS